MIPLSFWYLFPVMPQAPLYFFLLVSERQQGGCWARGSRLKPILLARRGQVRIEKEISPVGKGAPGSRRGPLDGSSLPLLRPHPPAGLVSALLSPPPPSLRCLHWELLEWDPAWCGPWALKKANTDECPNSPNRPKWEWKQQHEDPSWTSAQAKFHATKNPLALPRGINNFDFSFF